MNELFHVDSRSDPTGYPGRYKFELGRTLHGVEKIEVVHGEVPSSIFSFDDGPTEVDLSRGHYGDGMTSLNTMVFHVADSPSRYEVYSRIPAGDYDGASLASMLTACVARASPGKSNLGSAGPGYGLGGACIVFAFDALTCKLTATPAAAGKPLFAVVSMPPATGLQASTIWDALNYGGSSASTALTTVSRQRQGSVDGANVVYYYVDKTETDDRPYNPSSTYTAVVGASILNLMSPSVIFLVIENVRFKHGISVTPKSRIPPASHGLVARFQLPGPFGHNNFFSFDTIVQHGEVDDPSNTAINELDVRWVTADGETANFNGLPNSLQLMIFHHPI